MPSHNCQGMAPSLMMSLLVDQGEKRREEISHGSSSARKSTGPPFLAYNALLSVHSQGLLSLVC